MPKKVVADGCNDPSTGFQTTVARDATRRRHPSRLISRRVRGTSSSEGPPGNAHHVPSRTRAHASRVPHPLGARITVGSGGGLVEDLWLSPTLVSAVRAGRGLSRDLEEIPKDGGRELQRPPRRLRIDVRCPHSYGLKDADRVLVVRSYRIGQLLFGHVRKPGAPPRADLDAATFLLVGVAHERVVDDGMPGIEPDATPPAHCAHPLGHDRTLRRRESSPTWACLMLQTHPTPAQRVELADAWQGQYAAPSP